MKRWHIILGSLLLLGAALAGAAWTGLLPRGVLCGHASPEAHFVRQWNSDLRGCADPGSAKTLLKRNKEGGELVMMPDGSWVAVVMEHSCCTGAGFDATLYVASTGEAYLDSESCYCGWMPLGGELAGYPKTSIADFMAAVKASGKKTTRL